MMTGYELLRDKEIVVAEGDLRRDSLFKSLKNSKILECEALVNMSIRIMLMTEYELLLEKEIIVDEKV